MTSVRLRFVFRPRVFSCAFASGGGVERTSTLNDAVLVYDEVIADARPTVLQMPLVNRRCRHLAICVADMVQNDTIREASLVKLQERQIRLHDMYTIRNGCLRLLGHEETRCDIGARSKEDSALEEISAIHIGDTRFLFLVHSWFILGSC